MSNQNIPRPITKVTPASGVLDDLTPQLTGQAMIELARKRRNVRTKTDGEDDMSAHNQGHADNVMSTHGDSQPAAEELRPFVLASSSHPEASWQADDDMETQIVRDAFKATDKDDRKSRIGDQT